MTRTGSRQAATGAARHRPRATMPGPSSRITSPVAKAACLAAFLLGACTVSVHQTRIWNVRCAYGVTAKTGREVIAIDAPASAATLLLELDLRCTAGEVEVRLTGPDGREHWRERVRGGARDGELRLPARAGAWTCSLEFADYAGDWSAQLEAHSEPPLRVEVRLEEDGSPAATVGR